MSYCDCDYDPVDWFTSDDIKASRKHHQCTECRGPIFKGESYRRARYKFEGEMWTHRMCKLCIEMEQWAKISMPCFCTGFGDLHEMVREMVADIAHTIPGFFFEYGRRMVKIKHRRLPITC